MAKLGRTNLWHFIIPYIERTPEKESFDMVIECLPCSGKKRLGWPFYKCFSLLLIFFFFFNVMSVSGYSIFHDARLKMGGIKKLYRIFRRPVPNGMNEQSSNVASP